MSREENQQNIEEMYEDALDILNAKPKQTLKGTMFVEKEDGRIPYILILKRIKDKEIDPNNYIFIDNNNVSWVWNTECNAMESLEKDYYFGDTKSSRYLTEDYDELELIDLCLLLIPKEKEEDTPKYTAKQKVIQELEEQFMDLEMEIDNCQGCMNGLDEAFEILNIYKELVKYLGGDIDAHKQELVDEWFKKAKLRDEETKKEQKRKDEVIKKLPLDILGLITVDKPIMNTFIKQNDKINEICDVLIDRFKEKNI